MIPGITKISNELHITIHYILYSLFHVLIRVFATSPVGEKDQLKKKNHLIFFLCALITLQKKNPLIHVYPSTLDQ